MYLSIVKRPTKIGVTYVFSLRSCYRDHNGRVTGKHEAYLGSIKDIAIKQESEEFRVIFWNNVLDVFD